MTTFEKIVATVLVLYALVGSYGCAHEDPWTRSDTALQVLYTATLVADGYTTSRIQYRDDLHEAGMARFVLGDQPKTSDTWQYMASGAVVHYLMMRALPAKWRRWAHSQSIASQMDVVLSNCRADLC